MARYDTTYTLTSQVTPTHPGLADTWRTMSFHGLELEISFGRQNALSRQLFHCCSGTILCGQKLELVYPQEHKQTPPGSTKAVVTWWRRFRPQDPTQYYTGRHPNLCQIYLHDG